MANFQASVKGVGDATALIGGSRNYLLPILFNKETKYNVMFNPDKAVYISVSLSNIIPPQMLSKKLRSHGGSSKHMMDNLLYEFCYVSLEDRFKKHNSAIDPAKYTKIMTLPFEKTNQVFFAQASK